MQETTLTCKICGNNAQNKIYVVKEMVTGLREEFEYFECFNCGCLQLKNIPADISKYYPEDYYSFVFPAVAKENMRENFIKRYLKYKRTSYAIYQKGIVGRLLSIIKPPPQCLIPLRKCNATFNSKILDVGCGVGRLLLIFNHYGFKNVQGIDLYIKRDIIYENGVSIFKKEIYEMENGYDVITFHHSFEHMTKPLEILKKAYSLLNPKGYVLIRTPTTSSYAWRHYGVNWVQIDAPRHLFLHSLRSIELLASMANLKIKEITFDSTEFQFWGSEQYVKDIPLRSERSYYVNPHRSIFNDKEIKLFKLKASKLNEEKLGDQICVYLSKS